MRIDPRQNDVEEARGRGVKAGMVERREVGIANAAARQWSGGAGRVQIGGTAGYARRGHKLCGKTVCEGGGQREDERSETVRREWIRIAIAIAGQRQGKGQCEGCWWCVDRQCALGRVKSLWHSMRWWEWGRAERSWRNQKQSVCEATDITEVVK